MRVGRYNSMMLLLSSVLCVTGCNGKTDRERPPEPGVPLTSGPVLLNVAGAGYHLGDIVRIETNVSDISKGTTVLFDWRKAVAGQGWGPAHMIGQVVGLPGGQLDMSTFLKYRGRDGKEKDPWLSTFQRRGAKNYRGNITLPAGDYLVETERNIMIVDRSSIGARVVERLGHDDEAEKEKAAGCSREFARKSA